MAAITYPSAIDVWERIDNPRPGTDVIPSSTLQPEPQRPPFALAALQPPVLLEIIHSPRGQSNRSAPIAMSRTNFDLLPPEPSTLSPGGLQTPFLAVLRPRHMRTVVGPGPSHVRPPCCCCCCFPCCYYCWRCAAPCPARSCRAPLADPACPLRFGPRPLTGR